MEEGKHYVVKAGKLLEEGISKAEHQSYFPVLIGNGGTGATDAAGARLSLGVGAKWDTLWITDDPSQGMANDPVYGGDYNAFLIYTHSDKSSNAYMHSSHLIYIPVVGSAIKFSLQESYIGKSEDQSSDVLYMNMRGLEVTKSQSLDGIYSTLFHFLNSYNVTFGSSISINEDNHAIVPLAIYGTVI